MNASQLDKRLLANEMVDDILCKMDRDVNAAINILTVGMANYPELMPVEGTGTLLSEQSPAKQESNCKHGFA